MYVCMYVCVYACMHIHVCQCVFILFDVVAKVMATLLKDIYEASWKLCGRHFGPLEELYIDVGAHIFTLASQTACT
jgi:hypothetical protein